MIKNSFVYILTKPSFETKNFFQDIPNKVFPYYLDYSCISSNVEQHDLCIVKIN